MCHEVARYFVDPNVTVSIGITAINNVEDSIEQAIIRADEALYTVKSNGKNNALLNCF
ncbi:diguanylate cyclase [Vibrio scophthalmi]|uniref:diguanylate cyclase domain-containing protein n=1 Tax=Vibrio scophthalmi TaxID=45658 RepID=UPI003AAE028D